MGDEINADPLKVLDGTERVALCHCDVLQLLARLPDNSVDSMVTDPPAGIAFMSAKWDQDRGGSNEWIRWLTDVMTAALRVLKPGAHAFVWALPRTSHWTGMALENAGFEIRDCFTHLFGSGFPKSKNISLAIDQKLGTVDRRKIVHSYSAGGNAGTSCKDKGGTYSIGADNSPPVELHVTSGGSDQAKQWDGFGTAVKPAAEMWWLVRKPLIGTLAENVQDYGCGGLNIDACRVPTDWTERPQSWHASGHSAKPDADKIAAPPGVGIQCHPGGRHPANLLLSHADCGDRCVPGCPVRIVGDQNSHTSSTGGTGVKDAYPGWGFKLQGNGGFGDAGDCSRFFNQFHPHPLDSVPPFLYEKKPSRREKELGCEHLPKRTRGESTKRKDGSAALDCPRTGAGRSGGARNVHPTTKGVALMRHLCRLVTPPGGVCLDGFMGSGTTAVACVLEGFRFIGCDLNDTEAEPYVTIARARVAHAATWTEPEPGEQAPKQGNLFAGRER